MSDDLASLSRNARLRTVGSLAMVGIGIFGLLWIGLRGLPTALGGGPVHAGADVGAVRIADAAGQVRALSDFKGQVLVVDVWATWCGPCRRSLPEVAALQKAADGRYRVLAISTDSEGFAKVAPFFQAHPDLALDAAVPASREALAPFGQIRGIPTTFVIDRQGRVITRWSGYYPGRAEAELRQALQP